MYAFFSFYRPDCSSFKAVSESIPRVLPLPWSLKEILAYPVVPKYLFKRLNQRVSVSFPVNEPNETPL